LAFFINVGIYTSYSQFGRFSGFTWSISFKMIDKSEE
jgi:hypothetical protein